MFYCKTNIGKWENIFLQIFYVKTNNMCLDSMSTAMFPVSWVFFFFFVQPVIVNKSIVNSALVYWSRVPQITFFSNFFIKNGSHSTIYTFKNYFATKFLVFSFQFQQNKFYPNGPTESTWLMHKLIQHALSTSDELLWKCWNPIMSLHLNKVWIWVWKQVCLYVNWKLYNSVKPYIKQ